LTRFNEKEVNEMEMPGFTAENSIYNTKGGYCMATAYDSRNGSANVQPARKSGFPAHCRPFLHAALAAQDDLWAEFWWGALEGCCMGT
jgi:hypothetical protein